MREVSETKSRGETDEDQPSAPLPDLSPETLQVFSKDEQDNAPSEV